MIAILTSALIIYILLICGLLLFELLFTYFRIVLIAWEIQPLPLLRLLPLLMMHFLMHYVYTLFILTLSYAFTMYAISIFKFYISPSLNKLHSTDISVIFDRRNKSFTV